MGRCRNLCAYQISRAANKFCIQPDIGTTCTPRCEGTAKKRLTIKVRAGKRARFQNDGEEMGDGRERLISSNYSVINIIFFRSKTFWPAFGSDKKCVTC